MAAVQRETKFTKRIRLFDMRVVNFLSHFYANHKIHKTILTATYEQMFIDIRFLVHFWNWLVADGVF